MLDISGWELLLALAVALVIVRPSDLPAALRAVGRFLRRMRMLAREFRDHLDALVDSTGLGDGYDIGPTKKDSGEDEDAS